MRLRALDGSALVRWGGLLAVLAVLLSGPLARAGPPEAEPSPDTKSEPAEAPATQPKEGEGSEQPKAPAQPEIDWDDRAAKILALMDGTLALDVDAHELFSVRLDALDGDSGQWAALGAAVDEARANAEAGGQPPPDEPLTGRAHYIAALARFLAQPADVQQRQLQRHEERKTEQLRRTRAEAQRTELIANLTGKAELLEALIARKLAPDIDPKRVLDVDLLVPGLFAPAPPAVPEVPAPDTKQGEDRPKPAEGTDESVEDSEPDPLSAAQDRLQKARAAWLALPAAERKAILDDHEQRKEAEAEAEAEAEKEKRPEEPAEEDLVDPTVVEVEEAFNEAQQEAAAAAKARDRALEAARLAQTEALRRTKEEKARLLGVKEAQALFLGELSRRREEARQVHEGRLEWTRRVEELGRSSASTDDVESRADTMYPELREVRARARDDFRATLTRLDELGVNVPRASPTEESTEPDNSELGELRNELATNAEELVTREKEIEWEVAESLRQDMVALNRARLDLLELTSSGFRARVTGLRAEGLDQIRREFDEIVLELRYHARSLPRDVRAVGEELAKNPVGVLWVALELIVILVVFRAWRRRADDLLRAWHGDIRRNNPTMNLGQRFRRRVLWYARRIRKPLEWLLLLLVFPYLFGSVEDLPELRLTWLILSWWFGGFTVIQTLDAIAERQSYLRFRESKTAELRLKSLRILGVTVTIVGLLLTVTADIVGRGAIFAWVLKLCWFLAVPILLWLILRWRPVIFERVTALHRKNRVLVWIENNHKGAMSYPAAAVGGLYLFGNGVREFAVRQAGQLDATRRVLAYLFRREVAKQAEARSHRRRLTELVPDARCGPFDPEGSADPLLDSIVKEELEQAVELTRSSTTTLTAVVGERGMGKTTFLRRLMAHLQEHTCLIQCPPDSFDSLLEAFAREFEAEEVTEASVAKAIGDAGASTICIDDAQRLIEPTIGGLENMDRFSRFALRVGGDVSWVVSVDHASWSYLNRARGDRVFFDQVISLPRWTEAEITELIRKRTAAAQMHPNFDELVMASPFDDRAPKQDRERTELGYYRILWDHSAGNPAVALLEWRKSLFVSDKDDEPVVQLFESPSSREIEKLPLTLLFVLRGVVQLDLASEAELSSCTQLPLHDVADAIRFSITHGYLERVGDRVRVTWTWFRTITLVLTRQHLLVP